MRLFCLLASLFLALPLSAQWQLGQRSFYPGTGGGGGAAFGAQDIWTHFTTGTGNITATNMATGTAGTSNCTWSRNGTAGSLTVGASQTALPGSVGPVGGTTYPSSTTTQSIAINDGDNTSLPTIICTLGGSPGPIGTWSGYLTLNMGQAPTSNYFYDRVVITGSGSTYYAAIQIEVGEYCMNAGGYGVDVETAPGGTTTHTGCIPLAPGGKYWMTLQFNETTGTETLNVYNPTNFALIGTLTATGNTGGTVYSYRMGQNEGGLSSGTTSYIEDGMFNYTTHPLTVTPVTPPLAPTYVGQGSANSVTGSGTTITVSRTPASIFNSFAVIACTSATTGAIAITDSQTNSYTQNSAATNVGGVRCALDTKIGLASTSADTITATFGTSGTFRSIYVVECANCTAIDKNSGFVLETSTSGGAVSTASETPTVQLELGVGWFFGTNGNFTAPGWAPLAMETNGYSLVNAAQINSTSSLAAAALDTTGASGVSTATMFFTLK